MIILKLQGGKNWNSSCDQKEHILNTCEIIMILDFHKENISIFIFKFED